MKPLGRKRGDRIRTQACPGLVGRVGKFPIQVKQELVAEVRQRRQVPVGEAKPNGLLEINTVWMDGFVLEEFDEARAPGVRPDVRP